MTCTGIVALNAPTIVTAKKTGSGTTIIGRGEYQYEVLHDWPQLPEKYLWQTTQNVAVDSEGLLYVSHKGTFGENDQPTIFVFDSNGKYVRSFGSEFQGGGHGIEIRNEGGIDFLYVSAIHQQRSIAKVDLLGEIVWRQGAPMECGIYSKGEDKFPRAKEDNPWGRDRFNPTNIAFHPDGGFYVADGYGGYCVHRYDKEGNWVQMLGKPGNETARADATFSLPHGIGIDDRSDEPLVVIADRNFDRLQWLSLDGEHRKTLDGFRQPANIDLFGDLMVVPELLARLTILDKNNEVVAQIGTDSDRIEADQQRAEGVRIRADESRWQAGKFIHPHDACFDADGNLFVAEWVARGRVTKLRQLS